MYARASGGDMGPSLAGIAALIIAAPDYEVWPDNIQAINLFTALQTQIRTGAMGPTGFDYNVYFSRMDRMKLSDQEYEWLFDDVRVIEAEALKIINKKD